MKLIEIIKDKEIIICEESYKKEILKIVNEEHLFLNLKFYSKKEFIEKYYFKIKNEALIYLMVNYHLKIELFYFL